MRIRVHGDSHLACALMLAAELRGFELVDVGESADVVFAAHDVVDHADLSGAEESFRDALFHSETEYCPLVLASQVPPGTTRAWAGDQFSRAFCQVDTIIVSRAVERARAPEQFVVGCADPAEPLPLAYQQYLAAHGCPVLQMSYESAEVAKLGINYALSKQIEAANDVSAACAKVGADYDDVRRAMHNDARIGPLAYLRPGRTNQHLQRDVDTVLSLRQQTELGEN